MGANASKIDDALERLYEGTTSTPSLTRPPACVDKRHASSRHSPHNMILAPSDAGPPKCCRLPPIESYETVKAQIAQITRWDLVDSSEDLWQSAQYQERSAAFSPSPSFTPNMASHLKIFQKPDDAPTSSGRQVPKRHQSQSGIQASKKRRLILAPMASQIVSQRAETKLESLVQPELQPLPNHVIMDCDYEDEGYDSFTVSPTDFAATVDSACSSGEGEVDLVKLLANLHQLRERPVTEELNIEDSVQTATHLKAREEQAGAERSRLLRERALNRHRSQALPPEPSDEGPLTCQRLEMLNAKPTDEDGPLDVEQHIVQQSRRADAECRIREKERALIRQRSEAVSPEPLNEDSDRGSQHRNKQPERASAERRTIMRERAIKRQRSEALSNDAALNEGNLISSPMSSDNQTNQRPKSKHSTRHDTSQKIPNRLSGLEMLALRKSRHDYWAIADHRGASRAPMGSQTQAEDELNCTILGMKAEATSSPERSTFEIQSQRSQDNRRSRAERQHHDINEAPDIRPSCTSVPSLAKTSLTLPRNFDTLPEEAQSIIVQHEKAKERKRDLETIDRVTTSIARLRCIGLFTPQDERELAEVHRFIKLVLRENQYGKLARKRVQDIRCKIDQRAKPYDMPTQNEIQRWRDSLFDANDITLLTENLSQVEERISELAGARNVTKNHRQTRQKRKAVTFNLASGDAAPTSNRASKTRRPEIRTLGNRRTSQFASQEKQMELIRQRLSEFDARLSEGRNQGLEDEADVSPENGSDNESTVSEDISGVEYYRYVTPRHSDSSKDGHHTELGNPQQRQGLPAPSHGTQQFDSRLLEEMREKQRQLDRQTGCETGPAEAGASDAGDISSSGEEDYEDGGEDEDPKQLFQYTVWGTFCGVENYTDNDEYRFLTTYRLEFATRKVSECVVEFQSFYTKSGIGTDRWSLEIEFDNGLMDQRVHLGPDAEVEARFFVTKKVVDLGTRAYRRARAQNVAVRDAIYTVEWEHTLVPVREQHETEGRGEEDDLFGEDTSRSCPASFEPTTTTIPSSQLVYYNDVASANRQAMRIYLDWHFRFLPGLENEYWRRLEYENAEEQLRRLGDWGLWSREDTMEAEMEEGEAEAEAGEDDEDEEDNDGDSQSDHDATENVDSHKGQEEQALSESKDPRGQREETHDENKEGEKERHKTKAGSDAISGRKRKRVRESFKVWVRKAQVFGPGN
ncbi:uncharacterized protein A1O9_11360 [Exophiala aquamarina CBS 119918]|uniref:Uncharacterized protein n=1 Tax=Exophiala aquamarina CBS 119918 TaxID=1182545 RepID=A0A072NZS0_9EURO|nr:uncharacterized protein A1O9_11360 [Exophiala aquamarina CBS 119918]KEF52518.1 hypothetical protein A1O9_11360 [Exophiala aquamarina CBS 119918]